MLGLSLLFLQSVLAFVIAVRIDSLGAYLVSLTGSIAIAGFCRARYRSLFPTTLLLALSILFQRVPYKLWNPYVVPTVVFFLLAISFREALRRDDWLVKGHVTRTATITACLSLALSSSALLLWVKWVTPDLSQAMKMIPSVPVPLLILGAFVFAVFNAAIEELIFRGVLWEALEQVTSLPVTLVFQAIFFGAIHYQGFPSGWIGVGLASIFATFLGILRIQTKGLLIPFIVHILVDLTIFAILVSLR